MSEKVLGKIEQAVFGLGGYQASQIGISIVISGRGWGTVYFKGFSLEDTDKTPLIETMEYIDDLLKRAGIATIDELRKIPVECELEDNSLKSFRILEEVL